MFIFFAAEKVPNGFPSITVPTSTQVVEIGHAVVLLCGASGNPTPRIRWLRDAMPLDIRSNPRYTLLEGNMPGKYKIAFQISILRLNPIYLADRWTRPCFTLATLLT